MRRRGWGVAHVAVAAVSASLGLAGCSAGEQAPAARTTSPSSAAPSTGTTTSTPEPSPAPSTSADPSPTAEAGADLDRPPRARRPRLPDDERWLYFEDDTTAYASPWWRGRHRLQIAFGCTPAPYYVLDPRCDGTGYHHGYDLAIPCGTPLRAARPVTVLPPAGLGPAYGETPLLLRMTDDDGVERDVVVGHTREVYVEVGERVAAGELFARVSDSGVYTGCHLHFEVRAAGGSVSSAVDPRPLLDLSPRRDEL